MTLPASLTINLADGLAIEIAKGNVKQSLSKGEGADTEWSVDEAVERLRTFVQALREANRRDGVAVIVDSTAGQTREILRHERFRVIQEKLAGHLKGREADFLNYPLAKKATKAALQAGYTPAEIGAELAAGGYENLGLTYDEGRELFRQYLALLAEVHGPQTLPIVRKIAPVMMEVIRGLEKGYPETNRGESPPQPGSPEARPSRAGVWEAAMRKAKAAQDAKQ